ncbi:uncharacterized protein PV07_03307 [Cladophialophora immunda]|uniref:Uncharacterized protein n=1 Tax=Cladophialophora immunda TaxID=569365 RepID=A0A0D2B223_9EURO|nr:uncharacterized protein PV07_03307 [Cladophialophora immunda]KIW31707.1 hypothetical protein PV07_03307 [Cladophialophora immunda]OQV01330.1 hypothetical protein CLAIMM_06710 [Cladophialophora immunda]
MNRSSSHVNAGVGVGADVMVKPSTLGMASARQSTFLHTNAAADVDAHDLPLGTMTTTPTIGPTTTTTDTEEASTTSTEAAPPLSPVLSPAIESLSTTSTGQGDIIIEKGEI